MNRNISDLGKAILKKKLYILLITMILALTGVFYTLTNVKCVASQKFLVGENENRMDTYKELIKGSTVLEEAIANLGASISVQDLRNFLAIDTIENTNMFEIKVSGEEETAVRSYANEIANVFLKKAQEIYENVEIYQVDCSVAYVHNGNVFVRGIGFGMIGFVLSSLFFVVGFLLDTKIKSCKEIEEITGLKTLISIPNMKIIAKKRLTMKSIRAHKSEVFKTLMTNIQFVNINNVESKTILVTSAKASEGKSYVVNNLAIEFAKAGKKVILIDSDMRRGRLAKIFNLPNDLGFSNYLSNLDTNGNVIYERITRFINDTEIKNLNVITAGNVPPNPTELLKTTKVQELMKDLKVFYDIILFDSVPVLEAPEAAILSKECDLTFVVASYGDTKREEFAMAYEQIKETDVTSIGVGLNKIPDKRLKKKAVAFKINFKQQMNKIFQQVKAIFKKVKKISKLGKKIVSGFKVIFGLIFLGLLKIRKLLIHFINGIRSKSQNVKEYIKSYKAKREKIKLIEAGSMILENEEDNNIIKEVFESEMAKLETEDEMTYQKKLDELKNNLDEKSNAKQEMVPEEPVKVRPVQTKLVKSKFDLIREQQEKSEAKAEISTKEESENVQLKIEIKPEENKKEVVEKVEANKEEIKQEEIQKKHEALKKKQRIERERKEAEKRARQEEIDNFQDIDFRKQENLTEEMIRKQVEMDEMVRLAELEEEEEQFRKQQMKLKEKSKKRKERMEKFQNIIHFMKNLKEEYSHQTAEKRMRKKEERMEKESEKNESRVRIAKEKEEKRAYRELEKQRQKEELRINEELQEDNLYPRPRM